jgi:hypothetical protein
MTAFLWNVGKDFDSARINKTGFLLNIVVFRFIINTVDFLLQTSFDILFHLSVKGKMYLSIITPVSYLMKIVREFKNV